MPRDYKKIKAWQFADRLTQEIYESTKKFPKDELFGIVSQVRRAAVSVACNIVEGSARNSKKEYSQFLYIAKASLSEVEYLLHLSQNLGYLTQTRYQYLYELNQECARTLYGLIQVVTK